MNTEIDPGSKGAARTCDAEIEVIAGRSRMSSAVRAIIARRATTAGMCDGDYFREIIAGRAPRVTRLEAACELLPLA